MKTLRAAGRGAVACACAGVLLSRIGVCNAADRTWLLPSTDVFSVSNNWSGNAVPGVADNAIFNAAGTYSVLFGTNPKNVQARVTNGDVTLGLGGETYTLTSTGTASLIVGSRTALPITLGKLTINAGTLSDQSAILGNTPEGPGQISVGSATWTNAASIAIGASGSGALLINAGGVVSDIDARLGVNGSSVVGSAVIGGTGATWTTTGNFVLGANGTGNLTINPGGLVNCTSIGAEAQIAQLAGSHGTVNVAGGTWSAPFAIDVGDSGSGTLNVSSGTVSCGNMYISLAAGSAGGVNLTGGTVSCGQVAIGYAAGSSGTLNLSGSGQLTSAGSMYVGGNSTASGGVGAITISSGTMTITDQLKIWNGGAVTLNGGALSAGSLTLGGGTLDWSSGTLTLTNAGLTVSPSGTFQSLSLSANKSLHGGIQLGDASGAGTLNMSDTVGGPFISVNHGSSATIENSNFTLLGVPSGTVSATDGSIVMSGTQIVGGTAQTGSENLNHCILTFDPVPTQQYSLFLGIGGTGTLSLTNGSVATALRQTGPENGIGIELGYFTVASSGALLIDASNFSCEDGGGDVSRALVGEGGQGLLVISNGGVLQIGNVRVGMISVPVGTTELVGQGTVHVSGIGSWLEIGTAVGGTLVIGDGGGGSLSVTNSGEISALRTYLGQGAGSTGSVLIDAGNLRVVQELEIGYLGTATLTVSGGGSLQCGHGYVGTVGTSVGTMTLSGAGSSFVCSTGLDIGGGQSGWFTLGLGATLSPGGNINVASTGVFEYAGGTFSPTSLVLNGGRLVGNGTMQPTVSNTNGTVDVPVGTLTLQATVSNSNGSTFTKIGAGTAVLNSFVQFGGSGSLVADGGAIVVNNDAGAGGSLTVSINEAESAVQFSVTQHLNALNVNDGRALLLSGGNKVLVTQSLLVDTADAQVDLTDEDMIVDYSGASPIAAIAGYIRSGFGGGNWLGNGIMSTSAALVAADGLSMHKTALGFAEASTLNVGTFSGQSVDQTAVLLRYTYAGDASLDGVVNTLDFMRLANDFGAAGRFWADGDFNYDGVINALDFNALATNFGSTLAAPTLGSLVPEPTGLALSFATVAALFRRRRARF